MAVTTVNTKQILNATILNEDVAANAAILGTKITPDFGAQNLIVDTNVLFVDATTDRVGVGTATPGYKIEVVDNVTAQPAVAILNSHATGRGLLVSAADAGSYQLRVQTDAGAVRFLVGGEKAGFGTSSPGDSSVTGLGFSMGGVHFHGNSFSNIIQSHSTNVDNYWVDFDGAVDTKAMFTRHVNQTLEFSSLTDAGNYKREKMLFINGNTGEVVINEAGAGNIDFRVEGDTNSEVLCVDASADSVGIGTSVPSHKLHLINGNLAIENFSTGSALILDAHPGASVTSVLFREANTPRAYVTYSNPDDVIFINQSGSAGPGVNVNASNNVGIGTASPGADSRASGSLTVAGSLFLGVVAGNPAAPVEGQIWYNSTTKQYMGYDGTEKIILG